MEDILSDVCFELRPNAEFNRIALYRAVLEVGREERVGMDGCQTAIFDELNWYSFCMKQLVLLTVVCCVALFQMDPRSCHDHTGWVASFIAFERAAHCAISKDVIDAGLVGVVDPVDNYLAV